MKFVNILYKLTYRYNFVKIRLFSTLPRSNQSISDILTKTLRNKYKIQLLLLKHPTLNNVSIENALEIIDFLSNHDRYDPSCLLQYPYLLLHSVTTLKYRERVLKECGFTDVKIHTLYTFLKLVTKTPIEDLKSNNLIPFDHDVQENLIKYLSPWPTHPPMQKSNITDTMTLFDIRMKVLCRYLELNLSLPEDRFYSLIVTYKNIRHRPLEEINDVFYIIKNVIQIPNDKIVANFAVLHSKYDNVRLILQNVQYLGGIEIKEILMKKPTLLTVNYKSLLQIQKLLDDFGIPKESQQRCYRVFLLGYETVWMRLVKLSKTPDFEKFIKHRDVVKLIVHNTRADIRFNKLQSVERQFATMDVYIGQEKCYEKFTKISNKGSINDKVSRYIYQMFKEKYSRREISTELCKHDFYSQVPLIHVKLVLDFLIGRFDVTDIFENFQIILYPLDKIEKILNSLLFDKCAVDVKLSNVDISNISKKQLLSLVLYYMELKQHFSLHGIWSNHNTLKNKLSKNETVELEEICNKNILSR